MAYTNACLPLPPARATSYFRQVACTGREIIWTAHAIERVQFRGLQQSAVLVLMRDGFVYDTPKPGNRPGTFVYRLECRDASKRAVGIILTLLRSGATKIITVMWVDGR